MVKSTLTLTALATVLMVAPAMAQTNPAPATNAPAMNQAPAGSTMKSGTMNTQAQSTVATPAGSMGNVQYITQNRPDLWRASKLDGVDVYNDRNEKIGDISEVLLDREGKVEAVVIGVGGFLGVGEHNVAVPFNALQWQMNDDRTAMNAPATATGTMNAAPPAATTAPPAATTTAPTTTGTVGTPAATNNARATAANNDMQNYPDRAILAGATKDQLKNAPEFKYDR